MYKTVTEFSCFIKVQKVYVFPFKAFEQVTTTTTTLNRKKKEGKLWNFYVFRSVVLILYFIFHSNELSSLS